MSIKILPSEDTTHAATREHLLEAAGEVFAKVGFRAATVREICQRAGANIAAVNYYFGDKEKLYSSVLKESFRRSVDKYPANFGLPPQATAEQRLHAFVRSFLLRIFSGGPEARHGKLMAREMIEPTDALDTLVRENIRPMSQIPLTIISELLPDANEQTKQLCCMSVVSQVLFYHHCRPVMVRLFPDVTFDSAQIERLADHITHFSLAAMKPLAGTPPAPTTRQP